jgi:hypothetical protein
MTLRFLAGVALVAGAATVLAKRYRKQQGFGAATFPADPAAPTVSARAAPSRRNPAPAPDPLSAEYAGP